MKSPERRGGGGGGGGGASANAPIRTDGAAVLRFLLQVRRPPGGLPRDAAYLLPWASPLRQPTNNADLIRQNAAHTNVLQAAASRRLPHEAAASTGLTQRPEAPH
ncbi:unnamed protein product [Merluccius merluccius]